MAAKILVTGGCGYIGSHTVVELIKKGYEVVIIDDLSNSDGSALEGIEEITGIRIKCHNINVGDEVALEQFFSGEKIDAIIHFAAFKAVNESVDQPLKYYDNNIAGLLTLLKVMKNNGCHKLIFSSSCSVYGNAAELPVDENTPLGEIESPYARTKLMGEQILSDLAKSDQNSDFIALRYFNPAGAHLSNKIGESPTINASNLVPVITETAIGKRKNFTVFGNDYNTSDGTCVRDYIHVSDIGAAHACAVDLLMEKGKKSNFDLINLGSATGNTVMEVIHAFENVNNIFPEYEIGPRRPGDVISIYADNRKAVELLKWKPVYDLNDIVRTAWEWEKKRNIQ